MKHLREQVGFLQRSADAFDTGTEAEGKRLATSIRILVHDTKRSHSLLGQMGIMERLAWTDSAGPVSPRNLAVTIGLASMQLTLGDGKAVGRYVALLDDRSGQTRLLPFERWWTEPVSRRPSEDWDISRRDYVLAVSNTEGGAHVDPELDRVYEALSRDNAFRWRVKSGGVDLGPLDGDPSVVSVPQIAHEVQTTIASQLGVLLGSE